MLFVFLFGCQKNNQEPEKVEITKLTVMSVNDTHGAIEESSKNLGMAGFSWAVNEERKDKSNAVLVISAGDMFQGTAISNYTYGLNMINIMNIIGFKAMTIGNHEFDWGLDTVLSYVDGDQSNGEADFPFLACNIMEKETNSLPDLIKEYEIVDFDSFKVGIIGYIGVGLEKDIARSKVEDYEFVDPVPLVGSLATKLRTEYACDLIIAMGHDADTATNNLLTNLSGNAAVDMIVNGHTHATYTRYANNGNGKQISISQAGTAMQTVTKTIFDYDEELKFVSSRNMDLGSYDIGIDAEIQKMVQKMQSDIEPIMGEVIGVAGKNVTRTSVSYFTADEMLKRTNADLAGINSGGIRANAFPISNGSDVTIKKAYEIMPFDNIVVTCELTGQQLLNVLIIQDIVFSTNLKKVGTKFYINEEEIDKDKVYTFACADYLFERDEEIYGCAQNIERSELLVRDVIINGIREVEGKWLDSYE